MKFAFGQPPNFMTLLLGFVPRLVSSKPRKTGVSSLALGVQIKRRWPACRGKVGVEEGASELLEGCWTVLEQQRGYDGMVMPEHFLHPAPVETAQPQSPHWESRASILPSAQAGHGALPWLCSRDSPICNHCAIALAVAEKALFALPPIRRTVPTTSTRMTASITAYSAMSCPWSSVQSRCSW